MKLNFNRSMVLSKCVMFLLYVIVGSYIPFLNIFMLSAGLTATQAGFITGMRNLFYLAGVVWSVIADYTGYRKWIFSIELAMAALLFSPVPLIAEYVCPLSTQNKTLNLLNSTASNLTDDGMVKSVSSCGDSLYLVCMAMIFAGSMFDQAVLSFTDSIVINKVNSCKRPTSFGEQRLFGSVGFGAASLIVSLAVEYNDAKLIPKYAPPFFNVFIFAVILYPFAMKLLTEIKWPGKEAGAEKYSFPKTLKIVACSLDIQFFFVTVLIMGIGYGLSNGFLYVFMVNEISASNTIAGLTLTITFLSEFVMFALAKHFLKFLHGPTNCIIVGSFAYFVRFILMSYIYDVWIVVALQCLHAFGFALYWVAAIQTVNTFSPKQSLTTMMSILTTLQFGFADLLANVVGGYIYDNLNGRLMFRYLSFVYAFLTVVLVLYQIGKHICQLPTATSTKCLHEKSTNEYLLDDKTDNGF